MEGPQGRYIATREGRSKKTTAKKELAMGDSNSIAPSSSLKAERDCEQEKKLDLFCGLSSRLEDQDANHMLLKSKMESFSGFQR